jgi:aminopeptidase YwaD
MLKYWKSISWAILIFILLIIPGDKLPETNFLNIKHFDKLIHLVLFAILEFLALFDLDRPRHLLKPYLWLAIFALLFAVFTEIMQFITHLGREGEWLDLIADFAGTLTGTLVFRLTADLKITPLARKR